MLGFFGGFGFGALTVASGGNINLDNGAGTTRLNGTTLSFASGSSTISIEVGATSDLLNLSGAYSGSGVFTVVAPSSVSQAPANSRLVEGSPKSPTTPHVTQPRPTDPEP